MGLNRDIDSCRWLHMEGREGVRDRDWGNALGLQFSRVALSTTLYERALVVNMGCCCCQLA